MNRVLLDYEEVYSTYMRIKDIKEQQEYVLVTADKGRVISNGTGTSTER